MMLKVDLEKRDHTTIVRLVGELDHHSAEHLKDKLEAAIAQEDCHHIILNLKELSFMDSSGLGVLLGRYKMLKARGGEMVVCDASPAVYRLFEMSGLFKILSFQENEAHALARLGVVS